MNFLTNPCKSASPFVWKTLQKLYLKCYAYVGARVGRYKSDYVLPERKHIYDTVFKSLTEKREEVEQRNSI